MQFNPKYTITDKILNNLTDIASAREVIERAYLVPKWEAKLRRQALLRSAHASTALAGNKLSLKQVEALYAKRKKKLKNKACWKISPIG
ncbi:MAG: hypothetical protein Q8O13_11070 [Candidatus Omnitrophota bacterium]|nr:hypothetical protein [Candidatus Omnitrophota bacterium]